jgi:hypothetical protein
MADISRLTSDRQQAAKIVVATTVALLFISFWRAAAIVLSDLASSAFYAKSAKNSIASADASRYAASRQLYR